MKYNIVLPAVVCGVKGIFYGKTEDIINEIQMFQSFVFPEGLEDTDQKGSFRNIGILSPLISSEILAMFKGWTEWKILPEAMYAFVCRPEQPSAIRCQTGLNYRRVIQKSEMVTVNFSESLGKTRLKTASSFDPRQNKSLF